MSSRQIQIVVGLLIVIAIGIGLVIVADKNRKIIAEKQEAEQAAKLAETEQPKSQEVETQTAAGDEAASDVVPSFDVARIEPGGDGVIAGLAAPGALVELLANGVPIGSTTASDVGEWVIVLENPLQSGSHDLALRATPSDGAAIMSEEFIAVVIPESPAGEVLVVASRPGKASEILARPEATEQATAVSGEETAETAAASSGAAEVAETTDASEMQVAAAEQVDSPSDVAGTAKAPESASVQGDEQRTTPEVPDRTAAEEVQPAEQTAAAETDQPAATGDVSEAGDASSAAGSDGAVMPSETAEPSKTAAGDVIADTAGADGSSADTAGAAESGEGVDAGAVAGQETAAVEKQEETPPVAADQQGEQQTAPGVTVSPATDDTQAPPAGPQQVASEGSGEAAVDGIQADAASEGQEPAAAETKTEMASSEPSPKVEDSSADETAETAVAETEVAMVEEQAAEEQAAEQPVAGQQPADSAAVTVERDTQTAVDASPADETSVVEREPARDAQPEQKIQVAAAEPEEKPVSETPKVEVQLALDAVETEGDMVFAAGTGSPGSRVRVYVDNSYIGEAVANDDGRWLLETPAEIAAGNVVVRADEMNADTFDVARRAEVPFLKEVDSVALLPTTAEAGGGASETVSGAAATGPKSVIIRSGDNLWTISRRVYGRGIRYTTIYQANDDQIRNPHLIYPGQVFVLPEGDRTWTQ